MTLRSLAVAATIALLAGPALAQDAYWSYGDWQIRKQTVDTGEDLRTTCTAWTGGDGDPTLEVIQSDGDAGPPIAYPSVMVRESAPRHYRPLMRTDDAITFQFDDGTRAVTNAYNEIDEEGISVSTALVPDSLPVLRAMRRANALEIRRGSDVVLSASLRGFTAAYGKMAEACGFSTGGVIE